MKRLLLGWAIITALLTGLTDAEAATTTVTLADQPLFATQGVPGNLVLDLSVEYPTALSVANTGAYTLGQTYSGYFDSTKCYTYYYGNGNAAVAAVGKLPAIPAVTADPNGSYFIVTGASSGPNYTCAATGTLEAPLTAAMMALGQWSGNFLNWAATQTIDPFRYALTGGYRSVDAVGMTILEKAWGSGQGGLGETPDTSITSSSILSSGILPAAFSSWTGMYTRIEGTGNQMLFTGSTAPTIPLDTATLLGTTGTLVAAAFADPVVLSYPAIGTYSVYIRLKACDARLLAVQSNCVAYTSSSGVTDYKPQGLIQQFANTIRYAVFGYVDDDSGNTADELRDGGVLRASMKYVGPTIPNPTGASTANTTLQEWDPVTGILETNPSAADAAATVTSGTVPTQSGVINYLNGFGETSHTYKSKDPVGELYYAAIRYLKNLGNVAAYSTLPGPAAEDNALVDGFPIVPTWTDPILYSCQQNFILGIGDVNTHADSNLPYSALTLDEPAEEPEVKADTTVNVPAMTNTVGLMEANSTDPDLASYAYLKALGTTYVPWCCLDGNGFMMAGLAYDSHVNDIRPDLTGTQTISTYWLNVDENAIFRPYNQFWLAAKYGGFTVPNGFSIAANGTTPLPTSEWDVVGATEHAGSQTTPTGDLIPLPDHYFPAGSPANMVAGLTSAFQSIGNSVQAASTAFAFLSPQLQSTNDTSYADSYQSQTWTSDVYGYQTSFSTTGVETDTQAWDAQTVLTAQVAVTSAGVKGWDTNRIMATYNPAATTPAGVAFRIGNLNTTQVSNLGATGAPAGDVLNWIRGDQSNEGTSGDHFRSRSYSTTSGATTKTQTLMLGDIVDAQLTPLTAPNSGYSDSNNPGYSAFATANASRPPVLFAGGNDGMLHAFNGSVYNTPTNPNPLPSNPEGSELWAYVPSLLFSGPTATPAVNGLVSLTASPLVHHYFVDSTPVTADVDFGNTAGGSGASSTSPGTGYTPNWHTILVGGLGKGGMGYYALDVTHPAPTSGGITSESSLASSVLWEFSDPTMGYSYGPAQIVKTAAYGWVVLLTSGYDGVSTGSVGYLYVLNAKTGKLIQKISTVSASTGLAYLRAFVPNVYDYTADSAYGVDLNGQVWRFDLTMASAGTYPTPVLLASLTDGAGSSGSSCANGNPQPITTQPLVDVDPATGFRYVLVGTGQLLSTADISSTQQQDFYAIHDGTLAGFGTNRGITRCQLMNDTNVTSATANTTPTYGWYIDFPSTAGIAYRMVTTAAENYGVVLFAAELPNGSSCSPAGTSLVYQVSLGGGVSYFTTPYVALPGIVTDLAFETLNGVLTATAGYSSTSSGSVSTNANITQINCNGPDCKAILTTPDNGNGGLKRLNWREIPTPD